MTQTRLHYSNQEITTKDGTVYEVDREKGCVSGWALNDEHREEVRSFERGCIELIKMRRAYNKALDRGY